MIKIFLEVFLFSLFWVWWVEYSIHKIVEFNFKIYGENQWWSFPLCMVSGFMPLILAAYYFYGQ